MESILAHASEGVMTITMNRPEIRNAMDYESGALMLDHLYAAAEDKGVRVIAITGAGEGFCSGADVRRIGEGGITGTTRRLREKHHLIVRMLREVEKPTVAAVNGAAVGLGCDFALACDLRIASERARFGEIFVKRGIMPDCGGTWFLPRLVGLGKTMELTLLGDIIDAQEALKIGMVNWVVPHDQFQEEVGKLTKRLAAGPPIAYAEIKKAINAGLNAPLSIGLENEIAGQMRCIQSKDKQEGVLAWKEKREPKFTGE